jgi:formate hydrogenlyase subunit 4
VIAAAPSTLTSIAGTVVQVVLVVLGAPLLLGWMAKVRARGEGRAGPPVLQVLRDLRKWLAREALRATTSSAVLSLAPLVVVATALVAVAISPLVTTRPVMSESADILVVVYLLLTGSVAVALAGLDAGTAFGGMGSSRAMTIGALAEPALLVAVVALSIQAGSSNLPGIVTGTLTHPTWIASPTRLLALVALMIVVIAETGRLPVDNPGTHLELTMIHEAMVLEYAGPDLALVTLGAALRLGLLLALVANLFFPWGIARGSGAAGLALGAVALAAKVTVLATGVAVMEVHSAKLRLFRVPELLAGGFVLSVLAVISGLVTR